MLQTTAEAASNGKSSKTKGKQEKNQIGDREETESLEGQQAARYATDNSNKASETTRETEEATEKRYLGRTEARVN